MAEPQPSKINEMITTTSEDQSSGVPVVTAPVTVVSPGTAISGDVDAGSFVGRDTVGSGQRFSSSGSNVTFATADTSKLWEASMRMLQDISDIAHRLDDIPGRLRRLEQYILWVVIGVMSLILLFGAFWLGRL